MERIQPSTPAPDELAAMIHENLVAHIGGLLNPPCKSVTASWLPRSRVRRSPAQPCKESR